MKKFNQMTEKQMSQVNGGFVVAVVVGIIGMVAGIVGAAAGTVAVGEATRKK